MRRIGVVLAVYNGLVAISANAGEPDVFMRAVGFALTGSDNADPKAINRANCTFKLNDEIFRLNNLHTDRLEIKGWQQKTAYGTRQWVTVSLHGDDIVYETTHKPNMIDDGSESTRKYKEVMPDLFEFTSGII